MIWLLVEGSDDVRFFENALKVFLENKYETMKTWPYANKKKEKVNGFLKTLQTTGANYLLVSDMDKQTPEEQINELKETFRQLPEDKICLVKKEIESWYIAGVPNNHTCFNAQCSIPTNTESITKEQFNSYLKQRLGRLEAMLAILNDYSIGQAKARNESLNSFIASFL